MTKPSTNTTNHEKKKPGLLFIICWMLGIQHIVFSIVGLYYKTQEIRTVIIIIFGLIYLFLGYKIMIKGKTISRKPTVQDAPSTVRFAHNKFLGGPSPVPQVKKSESRPVRSPLSIEAEKEAKMQKQKEFVAFMQDGGKLPVEFFVAENIIEKNMYKYTKDLDGNSGDWCNAVCLRLKRDCDFHASLKKLIRWKKSHLSFSWDYEWQDESGSNRVSWRYSRPAGSEYCDFTMLMSIEDPELTDEERQELKEAKITVCWPVDRTSYYDWLENVVYSYDYSEYAGSVDDAATYAEWSKEVIASGDTARKFLQKSTDKYRDREKSYAECFSKMENERKIASLKEHLKYLYLKHMTEHFETLLIENSEEGSVQIQHLKNSKEENVEWKISFSKGEISSQYYLSENGKVRKYTCTVCDPVIPGIADSVTLILDSDEEFVSGNHIYYTPEDGLGWVRHDCEMEEYGNTISRIDEA